MLTTVVYAVAVDELATLDEAAVTGADLVGTLDEALPTEAELFETFDETTLV